MKKYPKSAVCIIKDKNDNILLLKRRKDDRTIPSVYCLPGGKSDKNERIEDTLIREVFEETGIIIDNYKFITEVRNIYFFESFVSKIKVELSNEHESYLITKKIDVIEIAPITNNILNEFYEY
jgi:8-oxo-dGTP pyrophosphatase MutT (NUDIX family)